MNASEDFAFDVTGFCVVRGALSAGEVDACRRALAEVGKSEGLLGVQAPWREPFRALLVHPRLVAYLNDLCGHGFRLDREPTLLGMEEVPQRLSGGGEPFDPARAYHHRGGERSCQGVQAIWALDDWQRDDGGPAWVFGSHRSNVEVPASLRRNPEAFDLLGRPRLRAGDLLLCAASLLAGFRPWHAEPRRLLAYGYAGRAAIQSRGTGPATRAARPKWLSKVGPVERALLSSQGYDDSSPTPSLRSDGERAWVDAEPVRSRPSSTATAATAPESEIDAAEFYTWDLRGYLIVPDVLTPEEVELANSAVDRFEDQAIEQPGLARGSQVLEGTARRSLTGPLALPPPYNQPFLRMLAHPQLIRRLGWMMGTGYRSGGIGVLLGEPGTEGHYLHDGSVPLNPSRGFRFQGGRSYSESVAVEFPLRDVRAGDGGFVCVPGSHKANYPAPEGIRSCEAPLGLVEQPAIRAGSALFFCEGALTHGALPWRNPDARRLVMVRYESAHFNWSSGVTEPETRWGNLVEGMDASQLAVMRGPERDRGSRNLPRLEVDGGRVRVVTEKSDGE